MKEEYDFSKGTKNPYAKELKNTVIIELSSETISYFEALEKETGIASDTLMSLYLQDCATKKKSL